MTDNEKIILIMKYLFECEFHLKNEYLQELNTYLTVRTNKPEDILKLYEKKTRYLAFKEFSGNLERLLYGGYKYE